MSRACWALSRSRATIRRSCAFTFWGMLWVILAERYPVPDVHFTYSPRGMKGAIWFRRPVDIGKANGLSSKCFDIRVPVDDASNSLKILRINSHDFTCPGIVLCYS